MGAGVQLQCIPLNLTIGTTLYLFGPCDPHPQYGTQTTSSSWILGMPWKGTQLLDPHQGEHFVQFTLHFNFVRYRTHANNGPS